MIKWLPNFCWTADTTLVLGILRDKFPKKNLGNVSNDIEKLIKTFSHGMLISIKKPGRTLGYEEDPSYATADVTLGRLNQQDSEIKGRPLAGEKKYPLDNLFYFQEI